MKPENFDEIKKLMHDRGNVEEKLELLKQSNCVTFSKNGLGAVNFDIDMDSSGQCEKFKENVMNFWHKRIEIIDEKLKEL
jgi:hypothetical protein